MKRKRIEFEKGGVRYVWMTPGRTAWGHQINRDIPLSEEASWTAKGWRPYDPEWENGPALVAEAVEVSLRVWWSRWRWVVAFVCGVVAGALVTWALVLAGMGR